MSNELNLEEVVSPYAASFIVSNWLRESGVDLNKNLSPQMFYRYTKENRIKHDGSNSRKIVIADLLSWFVIYAKKNYNVTFESQAQKAEKELFSFAGLKSETDH